jgi:chromosome segregation ATPase
MVKSFKVEEILVRDARVIELQDELKDLKAKMATDKATHATQLKGAQEEGSRTKVALAKSREEASQAKRELATCSSSLAASKAAEAKAKDEVSLSLSLCLSVSLSLAPPLALSLLCVCVCVCNTTLLCRNPPRMCV